MSEFKPGTPVIFTNKDTSGSLQSEIYARLSGKRGVVVPPNDGTVPVAGFTYVRLDFNDGVYRLPDSMLTVAPAEETPVEWDLKEAADRLNDAIAGKATEEPLSTQLLNTYSSGQDSQVLVMQVQNAGLDAVRRAYNQLRDTEEHLSHQARQARAAADAVASIVSDETRWASIDVAEDGENVPEAQCTIAAPHASHEWWTPLSKLKRACPGVGVRMTHNDASI